MPIPPSHSGIPSRAGPHRRWGDGRAGVVGGGSVPPAFRPDLYRGTPPFYDRFRLPYPPALFAELCERASVSEVGRLLDLACGPGTVTFPLCEEFAEVWAVDQEPEAVEFA